MAARERMEELWRQITALDQEYERLEERLRQVAADSPEAEEISGRLSELGSQLLSLYEERRGLIKQLGWKLE